MDKGITLGFDGKNYEMLNQALKSLIEDETDALANLCNSAALLFYSMKDINWAGFYLYKENQLILGPFQGKPACIRIPMGRGVCGTAAHKKEPIIVEDVHQFPGHIACDGASQSEIVLPIIKDSILFGVLDIDSPIKSRFNENDQKGLQSFIDILSIYVKWDSLV
ncbi:MAG: GAF domain-containing protein [Lachnospiraceae bacterium]|jgi:GAF domain-containing protein|nr:GAF domain-containing protein [Lachnospiraceae bacterium]